MRIYLRDCTYYLVGLTIFPRRKLVPLRRFDADMAQQVAGHFFSPSVCRVIGGFRPQVIEVNVI